MSAPEQDQTQAAAFRRERNAQVRGLLLLAALVLSFLLYRAHSAMHLFHPGWWRL